VIIVQHFFPRERLTTLGAASLAQSAEVIPALVTGKLFNRHGLRPIELQPTGRTFRLGQSAKVVAATCTTNLERNDIPVGRCYFSVKLNRRFWSR